VSRAEGTRHFQTYTCDIVVRATSLLLRGGLEPADILLIPHTCDALQGMGSVLTDFIGPRQPVLPFYLPRGRGSADREYLVDELRCLSERLAAIARREPTAAEWDEALAVEETADRALAGLYAERDRLAVADRAFYAVVRSREYLTAERFAAVADAVPGGEPPASGVRLALSGIVLEPLDLLDRISAAGGRVVGDDLACGARRLYPFSSASDPFVRLAERLLGAPPDPTRGSPIAERAAALVGMMEAHGAAGLIVYDVPFCEPELFDIPLLREHLAGAGYPVLHVESEMSPAPNHQTLTRIEAFVETLR
jgi:benzoyl-CoA reductase/2-hydroxyglutaryl-CoA dehydratase subunit BcrC/BadD/HgdB